MTRGKPHGGLHCLITPVVEPGDHPHGLLSAIEALIVSRQISSTERIAIGSERPQCWIVSRRIVKFAVVSRMIAKPVVRITCSILGAGAKSLMLPSLYQGGNVISRSR